MKKPIAIKIIEENTKEELILTAERMKEKYKEVFECLKNQ